MANNYLEFSAVLPNLTAEEETWLKEQLEIIYVFDDKEYTEDQLPKEFNAKESDWCGIRAWRDLEEQPDSPSDVSFCYEFCDDTPNLGWYEFCDDTPDLGWGRHLWFYTEEWGHPELVAHLVQKFLRKFRPSDCWSLGYAVTCSRPRVGQFGGGAVFVTADDIEYFSDGDFLVDQLTKLHQTQEHLAAATRLALWATKHGIVYELNDMVISEFEDKATVINNSGQLDQFLFLLKTMPEQSIQEALKGQ